MTYQKEMMKHQEEFNLSRFMTNNSLAYSSMGVFNGRELHVSQQIEHMVSCYLHIVARLLI